MKKLATNIPRPAITALLIASLLVVYWLFDKYDWGYAHVKLLLFALLFLFIAQTQILRSGRKPTRRELWVEVGLLLVVLQGIFLFEVSKNSPHIFREPISDIGYTTVHAAKMLVRDGENPYSSAQINPNRTDMPEGYRGFHYGPFMIAGYLPSAFSPGLGYKAMSLLYVAVSVLLLILLVLKPDESDLEHVANALFIFTAYFASDRVWWEILWEGANDVFHIMLILAALWAFKGGRVFFAGLLTGLSIASKFAPGAFLVPFMPLRDRKFWLGLGLGVSPYIPFFLWDPAAMWRNVFWLRVVIPADHTSLYWMMPDNYDWIFGAVMGVACLIALIWAWRRELDLHSTLVGFTLLLIVVDVTQRQVHGNHLIWFAPLFALLFLDGRDRLYTALGYGSYVSPATDVSSTRD